MLFTKYLSTFTKYLNPSSLARHLTTLIVRQFLLLRAAWSSCLRAVFASVSLGLTLRRRPHRMIHLTACSPAVKSPAHRRRLFSSTHAVLSAPTFPRTELLSLGLAVSRGNYRIFACREDITRHRCMTGSVRSVRNNMQSLATEYSHNSLSFRSSDPTLLTFSSKLQGGPEKLRQIFLAITLVNMDRY